jgi:hypothetical protein
VSNDDDIEATPDELLLELMDLVALAFPQALYEMKVSFTASEDLTRGALSNLDGKAYPEAPKRPDLGHDDNAVLDAINALLADFGEATLRQGGVKVIDGFIAMKDGPDGDRYCELHDEDGLVMSRRFDRSELRWLFYTGPLFSELEKTAARLPEQRQHVDDELKGVERFEIDMQQGTITFSGAKIPEPRAFDFELLGSWNDDTKRYLWSWANDQVPERMRRATEKLRASSTGEGLRAFTEASFGCPEKLADRLARHVAATMDRAVGVYRAPFASTQGKGFMYVALLAR